jgi:hypothetical protein
MSIVSPSDIFLPDVGNASGAKQRDQGEASEG